MNAARGRTTRAMVPTGHILRAPVRNPRPYSARMFEARFQSFEDGERAASEPRIAALRADSPQVD